MGHELEASARALAVLRVLNRSTSKPANREPRHRDTHNRDTLYRDTAFTARYRDTVLPLAVLGLSIT